MQSSLIALPISVSFAKDMRSYVANSSLMVSSGRVSSRATVCHSRREWSS